MQLPTVVLLGLSAVIRTSIAAGPVHPQSQAVVSDEPSCVGEFARCADTLECTLGHCAGRCWNDGYVCPLSVCLVGVFTCRNLVTNAQHHKSDKKVKPICRKRWQMYITEIETLGGCHRMRVWGAQKSMPRAPACEVHTLTGRCRSKSGWSC